jgi:predicted Fe-Mo cluster-binding NifX family protein
MKVCFPIEKDEGFSSVVFGHFGSAPLFLLVDTASNRATVITNSDQHHSHGACNPLKALKGQQVDGIVVASIGAGALDHLKRSGLRVFKAQSATVQENMGKIAENTLQEFTVRDSCPGYAHDAGKTNGHGNGCHHH